MFHASNQEGRSVTVRLLAARGWEIRILSPTGEGSGLRLNVNDGGTYVSIVMGGKHGLW